MPSEAMTLPAEVIAAAKEAKQRAWALSVPSFEEEVTAIYHAMFQAAQQPTADQVETAAYKRGFADGQIGLEAAIDVAVADAIAALSGPAEGKE